MRKEKEQGVEVGRRTKKMEKEEEELKRARNRKREKLKVGKEGR